MKSGSEGDFVWLDLTAQDGARELEPLEDGIVVVRALPLDFGEDEEGKQANGGFDPDALDWGDDYGEGEEEEAEFQSTPSASAGEPGRPQWVSNLGNITRNVTANAVRGASGLADQAKQGIGKLEAGRKIENATQKLQKGAVWVVKPQRRAIWKLIKLKIPKYTIYLIS